jgi:PAS domain S-box-containing protein
MTETDRVPYLATLGLLVATGLLVAAGIAGIAQHRAMRDAGNVSFRALATLDRLQRVRADVTDAETGQRGFVLTGSETYLEPYERGTRALTRDLRRLREGVEGEPEQVARVDALTTLAQTKVRELRRTIKLRRTRGLEAALAVVRTHAGQETMDEFRGLLGTMERAERSRAASQLGDRLKRSSRTIKVVAAATAIGLLLGAFSLVVVTREVRRRIAAERRAREEESRLRTTLRSIGDAVIATDVEGRVLFMNEGAQRLTGYDEAAGRGQLLDRVFRIVNETTRETVESPVAKVLREGAIVGLGNHTILLRPDGSELPIDDSGAPVRDADGAIMGVVLVFRDVSDRKAGEVELVRRMRAEAAHAMTEDLLREREHAAHEREALLADAHAANMAKDEFLAVLSHELRSPLSAMLTWVALLKRGTLDAERRGRAIETIERNARSQAQLVDDLLDVSRIVSGKLGLERVPVALGAIVQHVVETLRPDASGKGVEIGVEIEPISDVTWGDERRVAQVVRNLVANAIQFTSAGGRVTVSVDSDDGRARIRVGDTGEGIASDFLPHVFDRFRQYDGRSTRRHGGLGLGLAIVKSVVEAHGGRVAVESGGVGQGATFSVWLPVESAPGVVMSPWQAPLGASERRLDGIRILVVDDEDDMREALKVALELRGARVTAVGSAAEGLAAVRNASPDAIVSDISMPDVDGYQFIRRAQRLAESRIPAIALTGFASKDDREQAASAGFDEHLAKPIDPDQVIERIGRLVGARRALRG